MAKTKAELEHEIAALRKELADANRSEVNDTAAQQIYDIYQAHIRAGFSEEQAWELIKLYLAKAK